MSMTTAKKDDAIDPRRVAFGMRLKAARESLKFTQDDIAKKYSVNKATVSAWETGRGDPGVFRLHELSKLYGLSADTLLGVPALSEDALKFVKRIESADDDQKRVIYAMLTGYLAESAQTQGERWRQPAGEMKPILYPSNLQKQARSEVDRRAPKKGEM
jgi:transcriptional regulator with XRE-family HTH domain